MNVSETISSAPAILVVESIEPVHAGKATTILVDLRG